MELLLIALLVVNSLVLGLCLLLVVSRRHLGNYGSCGIHLEDGRELVSEGGNSLLMSLVAHRVFIPSACGGRGTCGCCKVRITEGGGPVAATERSILTHREILEQTRLSCQVKVRGRMKITLPEEFRGVREFEVEVVRTEAATDLIRKITFGLRGPSEIDFKPGQYIQTILELPDEEPVIRGYSVASSPTRTGSIELDVRLVEGGIMSSHLHRLEVGSRLKITGPYGDLFLRETTDRTVVCIAGGVGLAPMKSIISFLHEKKSGRKIYLFHGVGDLSQLYDRTEFEELGKLNPRFIYVPAISDDATSDIWTGQRGLVTEVFSRIFPKDEPAEAYVCGPPAMVQAVLPLLREKGIRPQDTFHDAF